MARRKAKIGDLVLVEWVDALTQGLWRLVQDAAMAKPDLVKSVGWVVRNDEVALTLAASIGADDEDHDVNSILVIPRGIVKKVTFFDAP